MPDTWKIPKIGNGVLLPCSLFFWKCLLYYWIPLYFQFKVGSPSMVWEEKSENSCPEVKREQHRQTTSRVLDQGLCSKRPTFQRWLQNWLSVLRGASDLPSLLGFLISTVWTMLLPHTAVAKFNQTAHVRHWHVVQHTVCGHECSPWWCKTVPGSSHATLSSASWIQAHTRLL